VRFISANSFFYSAGSVEEFQRLRREQVVVLEDAAVAGARVDAELGVGQQLGEVERAARRQTRGWARLAVGEWGPLDLDGVGDGVLAG
jgi:hypothetical protein